MRDPWVAEIHFGNGSLGAVEADFCVRSVTEQPVLGITAPAEGILFLYRIPVDDLPDPAVPLIVVTDFCNNERDPAGNDIGAVFADGDFH